MYPAKPKDLTGELIEAAMAGSMLKLTTMQQLLSALDEAVTGEEDGTSPQHPDGPEPGCSTQQEQVTEP